MFAEGGCTHFCGKYRDRERPCFVRNEDEQVLLATNRVGGDPFICQPCDDGFIIGQLRRRRSPVGVDPQERVDGGKGRYPVGEHVDTRFGGEIVPPLAQAGGARDVLVLSEAHRIDAVKWKKYAKKRDIECVFVEEVWVVTDRLGTIKSDVVTGASDGTEVPWNLPEERIKPRNLQRMEAVIPVVTKCALVVSVQLHEGIHTHAIFAGQEKHNRLLRLTLTGIEMCVERDVHRAREGKGSV